MTSMDSFSFFTLLAVAVIGYFLMQRLLRGRRNPLGVDGELIWIDRGRKTKPFFNRQFRVLGKPDLMYRLNSGGVLAVEYKGRQGRIYDSDVVQAKAAALAARGEGYAVRELLVKTKGTEQRFSLAKADGALFNEIRHFVECARSAKKGAELPARPLAAKCRTCAFGPSCDSRFDKVQTQP